MNSSSLLFAGEIFDGRDCDHPQARFTDGRTFVARVRQLPARHLTTPSTGYLDLYRLSKEADILQLCVQRQSADPAKPAEWTALDEPAVDALDDATHERLLAAAEQLNFSRAVSQAERQIARGTQMLPLDTRMAETMLAPTRRVLDSWTSSLTTQISAALAGKQS